MQHSALRGGDTRLAVVVITRNRREELLCALKRLAELPERPRVAVIDNGSQDGTAAAVAGRFAGVEVVSLEKNLGAAARNLGVKRLDHKYIAFCDDDMWWTPGALAQAADLMDAHPRLGLINARVLVEPGGREDLTCLEMERSPLKPRAGMPGRPLLGFMAGASIVRRAAYLEAGGFPAAVCLGGEEEWLAVELAARDWSMCYVPHISVHHQPSPQRNPAARRCQQVRNALWFAWLRRPLARALHHTVAVVRQGPRDRAMLRGFVAALTGLPRLLPQRKVLPPEVEKALRELEIHRANRRWNPCNGDSADARR